MNEHQSVHDLGQYHGEKADYGGEISTIAETTSSSPFPFLEMGSSFVIGLAVGYFLKKSFKAVLFVLGLGLIVLFYMESQGLFTLNDAMLDNGVATGIDYFKTIVSALKERLTNFTSGLGAVAGFLVGIKFG